MITRIEALSYRCLRYVSQPLDRFHVLIGPNASGKTTFLDVVAFLGRLVSGGLDEAISERTQNFQDLVWSRSGDSFELAIELEIPEHLRSSLYYPELDAVRYEVAVDHDVESNTVAFRAETVLLKPTRRGDSSQPSLFPNAKPSPGTILQGPQSPGTRMVVTKEISGHDHFYAEAGDDWVGAFKLGPRRCALANLPEDETKFPVATWLKGLLSKEVQQLILNSLMIRNASPPGKGLTLLPDGSNLPWVVWDLEKRSPERFHDWVAHLQTALPDLEGIRVVERKDDRHRYLMLRYRGGLEIPSWMASDGTLRLLTLTLLAYLEGFRGIYLIEEPENGIHPRAVESMLQSLSSVYDAQVLLASHSPVVLSIVDPDQILCLAKDDAGATDIVSGSDHPALRDWRREPNLSVLFAAGVLG